MRFVCGSDFNHAAVSACGSQYLCELMSVVAAGQRAVILFCVTPVDGSYAAGCMRTLREVVAGVSVEGIVLENALPVGKLVCEPIGE